jgi:hypothetical protein
MITPAAEEAAAENPSRFFWTSCCVRLDKRAVVYFSQLAVGATVISFCISMLVLYQDCVTFSRWGPLLSFVVGVYMPQPALNRGP